MENKEKDLLQDIKSGVQELGKQVGKLFGDTFQQNQDSADIPIKTDIFTTKTHFVIEMELSGIPKNQIQIQIHENILSIKGNKVPENQGEIAESLKKERKYGSFIRNFDLPPNIKLDEIKAKADLGVLVIRFPLITPAKDGEDDLNVQIE